MAAGSSGTGKPLLALAGALDAAQEGHDMAMIKDLSVNVLGEPLQACSSDPVTGFFRNGACDTCAEDQGSHTVCAEMTAEFLAYSKYVGNDLSTPRPEFAFPGLKPGDRWCLCASRFLQAADEGAAPKVSLAATHRRALEIVPLAVLVEHASEV
jgi:uncharacterized protein (DUF2237 family)